MSAWLLPAATAAWWAGLLLGFGPARSWVVWAPGVLGLAAIVSAAIAAPATRGRDPVAEAGLVPSARRPVAAVERISAPRRSVGASAVALTLLVCTGVCAVAVCWALLAQRRLATSPLAARAPDRVEVDVTLREDPRPGALGWHALADVRLVRTPDGAASALRETVWLSGDEEPPAAARGDLRPGRGFAPGARRPGVPRRDPRQGRRGHAAGVAGRAARRLAEPVRSGDPGGAVDGGPVDRGGVPRAGSRVADGPRARRRLAPRRGRRARLQGHRAHAPARGLRRQRRDGARPGARARDDAGAAQGRPGGGRPRHGRVHRRAHRRGAVGDAGRRDVGAHPRRPAARPRPLDRGRALGRGARAARSCSRCWCDRSGSSSRSRRPPAWWRWPARSASGSPA